MKRAVIYGRYSSDKQNELSIDAQVRACTEYAQQHNLCLVDKPYADEAISGKKSKTKARAEYMRLRRDMKKGLFDVVLIHKFDRIARSVYEHVSLAQHLSETGVELIAVAQDYGDSKEAKIIKTLQWALSEYFIENLADETRKGLREVAENHQHTGGYAPFGYDIVDKHYVINEVEAEYVRRLFHAAASRAGFTEILHEMNVRGIVGKRGKPFAYNAIHSILKNEKYTGTYLYSTVQAKDRKDRRTKATADIRAEGAIPQIIDKALFDEVQQVMATRQQTGHKVENICGGLVYCHCGAKMHAHNAKKGEHNYPKWRCSAKGCPVKYVINGKEVKGIPMGTVDEAAQHYLHELLSPENQTSIADALRKYQQDAKANEKDFKENIRQEIEAKQHSYDALMANLESGALPKVVVAKLGEDMEQILSDGVYRLLYPVAGGVPGGGLIESPQPEHRIEDGLAHSHPVGRHHLHYKAGVVSVRPLDYSSQHGGIWNDIGRYRPKAAGFHDGIGRLLIARIHREDIAWVMHPHPSRTPVHPAHPSRPRRQHPQR